jgi:Protein of unknown function (DUF2905)
MLLLYFLIRLYQTSPMPPFRDLGRMLIFLGLIIAAVGLFLSYADRLPFRLGRLPGDILHRGDRTTFYFPITTSILISVVLTFVLWLFSQFRR